MEQGNAKNTYTSLLLDGSHSKEDYYDYNWSEFVNNYKGLKTNPLFKVTPKMAYALVKSFLNDPYDHDTMLEMFKSIEGVKFFPNHRSGYPFHYSHYSADRIIVSTSSYEFSFTANGVKKLYMCLVKVKVISTERGGSTKRLPCYVALWK